LDGSSQSKGWNKFPTFGAPPASKGEDETEATLTGQGTSTLPDGDATDVALACQGDQQAFERLYRLHVARIRGLARRMAGFDAADELTQDVFVRAWEKLGTFRGESRFATWLYRLAVNVMIESRRTLARRAVRQEDNEEAVRNASVRAADGVFGIDFGAAVNRLPDGARRVFVLHDVEGYKHHEIAKLMGIATGTSKGQLSRARTMLRQWLSAGPTRTTREGSVV
jgi:RNA polymerase sigma factor (sigma-70 family)